jgi:hypothetical protein
MAFGRLHGSGLCLSVIIGVLVLSESLIGFHFEEDIADHTGLVFVVVKLLDNAFLGGSNFSKLLIRLNISYLLELFNMVSLLYVQLLHLPFLDLLP